MAGTSLDVLGMDGVDRALGVLAGTFKPSDLLAINRGIIRPHGGVAGMPSIMRRRWTLEEQVMDAFKHQGRTVVQAGWVGYNFEPKYAQHKIDKRAGLKVGIWRGSERPLHVTFLMHDPDHIESVGVNGFEWGSKRYYAWRFHVGGWQRWDKVDAPPRPIINIDDRMMLEVARGHQRYLVAKLRAEGLTMRDVRIIL